MTLFVGPNGAGKSNIIDAIKFVRDALRNGLDWAVTERHGIENIRQWAPTRPYHVSVGLQVRHREQDDTAADSFCFTLSSSENSYKVHREEGRWRSPYPFFIMDPQESELKELHFSRYKNESVNANWQNGPFKFREDEDILFMSSQHAPPFSSAVFSDFESYSIFPNTLRQPEKPSTEPHLTAHGDNIASILKRMSAKRKSAARHEIVAALRRVVPDLENVTVQALGGYVVPRFFIKPEQGKGHYFDVDQMSDGTLRILGILVALYQDPGPEVIALEEPELTVHPGVLPLIADAIKEVSDSRQVLVTTHSPELLDQFDPDQVIAVEYEDGATRARPLAAAQKEAVRDKLFTLGQLMSFEGLHG